MHWTELPLTLVTRDSSREMLFLVMFGEHRKVAVKTELSSSLMANCNLESSNISQAALGLFSEQCSGYIPALGGTEEVRGLAPKYARLTLALRPSIIGFGSFTALSADSWSHMVTCQAVWGERRDCGEREVMGEEGEVWIRSSNIELFLQIFASFF